MTIIGNSLIMPNLSNKRVREIVDSSRADSKELLTWFKKERGWSSNTLSTERAEQFYAKFILMGYPTVESLNNFDWNCSTRAHGVRVHFTDSPGFNSIDIRWLSIWLPRVLGRCSSCECEVGINKLTGEWYEWCKECTMELEEAAAEEAADASD